MKTDELIGLLAATAGPTPRAPVARRVVPAAALGLAAAVALALAAIGLEPAAQGVPLLLKLSYTATLVFAAAWLVARHARPAMPVAAPLRVLVLVIATMAALGALSLWQAAPGERVATLFGRYWLQCPWTVLALSLPALAAMLWALRGLAPTRPQPAGLAAGLLAGALAAFGYSLACPEASAAFVAAWYTLGILLAGGLGALLGPWALRW
jgi:hypothetical protein